MFWTAVKVLFFRQIYGFKHRWIVSVLSVVIPILFLAMLHAGKLETSRESASTGTSNPLQVVVTPFVADSEQLISEAYRILQFEDSNPVSNLHVVFTANAEQMNQTLRKSEWPSIVVQFHEISRVKLEYTLRPVIPVTFNFPGNLNPQLTIGVNDEELSRVFLQVQSAIDAAYIRKYSPGHGNLRIRFLDSPDIVSEDQWNSPDIVVKFAGKRAPDDLLVLINFVLVAVFASFVSLGLIMIMTVLASYIIRDKLSGVRELLCINGVPRWMVSSSWLFTFCLLAVFIALLQNALLIIPHRKPLIPHINPFLLAILLIVHGWTALMFSNFVANLLTSQLLTNLLISIYWFVTTIVSWVVTWKIRNYLVTQAFISILPNFGYAMFITVLAVEFHSKERSDLSFGDLFTKSDEYISTGMVLLMMLVNILIFLTSALYLDAVKPGPYGRARPWYLFSREKSAAVRPADRRDDALVQKIRAGVPIGLTCVNIVKMFGTHKALNDVNLKIIKNRVTILLGHNGAGKTTLFSILCGMFSPTSGDVYTEKYNIFKGDNINKFRRVLGYCPQENLLINELTVQEHLIIFGMLKGLTKSEAMTYSDQWTEKFYMSSMRSTQAKKLSGGSKRKLCLAIAMTGDPEYLLLDEPSAGLDIESTRLFCDLILEEKGNCTVVVTTHNMDEADILGDRIAILAHGQLKCYGESSFLMRMLDTGYRLNCISTSTSTQHIIQAVNRYMKGATVLYKMNRSVTFRLPSNMMQYIPDLLRRLEEQFGDSVSSTLNPSTLDDVFVKVQKDLGVKINVEELPSISEDKMNRPCCVFSELLRKRAKWMLSRRMVTMILLVILLPSLAMTGDMFLLYSIISSTKSANENVSNLSASPEKEVKQFALSERDDISDLLRSALKKSGISFKETSNNIVVNIAQNNLFEHRSKLPFTSDNRQPDTPTAYFPKTDDSISTAYSALVNALLQGNASIITHRPFFRKSQNLKDISCPISGPLAYYFGYLFSMVVLPFFLAASTYFLVFPHEERTTLFKHLQLMTGLQPAVYWLVNFLFDMGIFASSFALLITIIVIIDHLYLNVFLNSYVIGAIILVFCLYGLSSIMFSYVWSFFFHTHATAIRLQSITSIFVTLTMQILSNYFPSDVSLKYAYFLPWSILWYSLANIVGWALLKNDCDQCNTSCNYLKEHPLFQKVLKTELICFGAVTIGYFLILMFLDYGLGRRLFGMVRGCFGRIDDVDIMDSEVANEKQRVDDLGTMDEDHPELVCDGLGKKYSCKKTAVYDVTFTAERGECFGLVGVNGSGKTTTFGMLAALLCLSKGNAVIEGRWELADCEFKYMKRVGYCPQNGGLLKELSARTILTLFGRLSGVPESQIKPLVDKWINALDMADIATRPCGCYSGGNKRKLSLAIALIGCQSVVLLDEPTAGVGPVVRRRIWEILTASLEQHQQTVILTSHTMSECEAICDRLTIMVKGVMQCLGPIPKLKERFGKSYILEVKFTPNSTIQQQNSVQSQIESRFRGYIELDDSMLNRLKFKLEIENLKIYDLFAAMLQIRSNNPVIEDFNLSETPLEEVFLMFAEQQ